MDSGIKVADFMTRKVVTVSPNINLVSAAKLMNKFRIGGLPVVSRGKFVGIITERDIMRRCIAKNRKPGVIKVKDIMTKKPFVAYEHDDMNHIAKLMATNDITRIPILTKDKLVGIVTNRDVLKHAPDLLDIVLEQAAINNSRMPTAFGKCDHCGEPGSLTLSTEQFLCSFCLKKN